MKSNKVLLGFNIALFLLLITFTFYTIEGYAMVLILIASCSLETMFLYYVYNSFSQKEKFVANIDDIIEKSLLGDFRRFKVTDETYESKLQFKLRKLFTIMDNLKNEAKENEKELQGLIADISHQFKTPLASIKICIEILNREDLTNDERVKFLINLNQQVDKLEFLILTMVKISRLDNDIIDLHQESKNVYETVLSSIGDVFLQSNKRDISISINKDDDIFAFHDKKWTTEAIANILDNCIKYSPQHSQIDIVISKNEFFARIEIIDYGKGIDNKELNDIFSRFYRGTNVKDQEGVGIGLYLSRLIVMKQKGFITVRSQLNEGSNFTVFLPLDE